MANTIQIKRGNKADLPILKEGELGLCKDSKELFIGLGTENLKLNSEVILSDEKIPHIYDLSFNIENGIDQRNKTITVNRNDLFQNGENYFTWTDSFGGNIGEYLKSYTYEGEFGITPNTTYVNLDNNGCYKYFIIFNNTTKYIVDIYKFDVINKKEVPHNKIDIRNLINGNKINKIETMELDISTIGKKATYSDYTNNHFAFSSIELSDANIVLGTNVVKTVNSNNTVSFTNSNNGPVEFTLNIPVTSLNIPQELNSFDLLFYTANDINITIDNISKETIPDIYGFKVFTIDASLIPSSDNLSILIKYNGDSSMGITLNPFVGIFIDGFGEIGDLTTLQTANKSDLVQAINELVSRIHALEIK